MSPRESPAPHPQEAADLLVAMLDLEELAPSTGTRTSEDRFLGPVVDQAFWRVFGGQVLAQAAQAGMRTVESDRVIHSLHGYFLRPGTRPGPSSSAWSGCATADPSPRAAPMPTRTACRSCR